MSIQIAGNIAFLRKQRGITQEAFAQAMGVTNQAVSKWEGGASCPDIALLPRIADYFGVSIDELLGHRARTSAGDAALRIKAAFQSSPPEESFDLAFQLCHILHEGAISRGYTGFLPWQPKDRDGDALAAWTASWGYSACSEPEGVSILRRGAAFFSSAKVIPPVMAADIRALLPTLEALAREDTLRALFALHALTQDDPARYVPADAGGAARAARRNAGAG